MDIFWIKDKQRKGPATVPDVISLVQMGELTPETLGWHKGCPDWKPLKELPALSDFLQDLHSETRGDQEEDEQQSDVLPPVPPAPGMPGMAQPAAAPAPEPEQGMPNGTLYTLASPGKRLFAKLTDLSLYAAALMGAFYLMGLPYSDDLQPGGLWFWLGFPLVEALVLVAFGNTPGKALMGIHLEELHGHGRLSLVQALKRSSLCFFLGYGMCMFPVALIMAALSYWQLRRRGITFWDITSATLPLQGKEIRTSRYFVTAIIIYAALTVFAHAMRPWLPDMINTMAKVSPEQAHAFRQQLMQVYPELGEAPAKQTDTPAPPVLPAEEAPAPAAEAPQPAAEAPQPATEPPAK